ncbi:MAG: hypothetical protein GXY40_10370 [Syntrophomonadaceae bacterium]|jgi:hypothetical protein|nr:hypothetical protein [Syntrophomonadaceae bacterium]
MMNNEEKILKMLESMQQGQNMIAKQVNELSGEFKDIRQSQVRMENELTEKVRALFDAREVQNDVNERIMSTLDRIEAKVDVLQLETAHLRRVK